MKCHIILTTDDGGIRCFPFPHLCDIIEKYSFNICFNQSIITMYAYILFLILNFIS